MRYGKLGRSDIETSIVGLKLWSLTAPSLPDPPDDEAVVALLRAAFDAGFTFYEMPVASVDGGRAERLVSRALRDKRRALCFATKIDPAEFGTAELRAAVERSLRNLDTERIDLVQLAWGSTRHSMGDVLGTLDQLRQEGKLREYGVCNFGRQDLVRCLTPRRFPIAANQIAYNLVFRAVEFDIAPFCRQERIDMIAYAPLMGGLLGGRYEHPDEVPDVRALTRHFSKDRPLAQHGEEGCEAETFATIDRIRALALDLGESIANVSLAWVLAQPGVTAALVGARTAYHLRRNARGGDLMLAPGDVERLCALTDELKQRLGPDADPWERPSRVR